MASVSDSVVVTLFELAAEYVKSSKNIEKEKQLIAVNNAVLFGRILPIVEAFVRAPNENSSISLLSENLKTLPLPSSSAEKSVALLRRLKNDIYVNPSLHQLYFPTLSGMKWRVDITISSSVLSRVLEPNIIMELEFTDGHKVTFELSVSKFHKLRFTIASILKEMDYMDNKMSAVKV